MISESPFNQINEYSELKGEFSFQGTIHCYGHIAGTIHCAPGSQFIIEKSALIEGSLECDHVIIKGEFRGEHLKAQTLKIESEARVEGSIQAQALQVFPGASLLCQNHIQGREGELL